MQIESVLVIAVGGRWGLESVDAGHDGLVIGGAASSASELECDRCTERDSALRNQRTESGGDSGLVESGERAGVGEVGGASHLSRPHPRHRRPRRDRSGLRLTSAVDSLGRALMR